jgi:hypothetical protein
MYSNIRLDEDQPEFLKPPRSFGSGSTLSVNYILLREEKLPIFTINGAINEQASFTP